MTTIYSNQTFSITSHPPSIVLSDVEFRECYFEGCAPSVTRDPRCRSVLRNARFVDCSQRGCSVYSAIVEDVEVENLDTCGQLLQSWGAVFNRVVLRGKIGRLMMSSVIDTLERPDVQAAFDKANAEYYKSVEWALDIRDALVKELDLRGVPARLIRRDTETQVLVTRERALSTDWSNLPLKETLWKTSLILFLKDKGDSEVFVAPKRHPKFRQLLDDLMVLRKEGIAEPD